jgi:gamma-tubulin complex component 3
MVLIILHIYSQELMNHLRSVYGPILELQMLEETFLARATAEYEARVNSENFIHTDSENKNQWGRTKSQDIENVERKSVFLKYLNTLSMKLKLLSRTYQVE